MMQSNMAQYMNPAMQSQYNMQGYTPQQWAAMQQWSQQWQQMSIDATAATKVIIHFFHSTISRTELLL